MKSGIYAIYWENLPNLIYIGKSQNISTRFRRHAAELSRNVHSNYKVQNTYNTYGEPKFIILELTNIENLNSCELIWQNEFDSLSHGLDLVVAGNGGYGPGHNTAKYTKLEILKVFRLLKNPSLSYQDISNITMVLVNTIEHISRGNRHLWLKDIYPKTFYRVSLSHIKRIERNSLKESPKALHNSRDILPIIINTITKEQVIVTNTTQVAKNIGVDQGGLSRLINHKAKRVQNWILYSATM